MPITFQCRSCRKEVTAPDAAGGKKGKCPFCGQMNDIPLPVEEEDGDLIPLAPIDEEEERRIQRERRRLYEQEQELLSELGGPAPTPLDEREELASEDLHHFVVNYCLDMAAGKLQRARQHIEQLKRHSFVGVRAVDDFISGSAREPAMDHIPRPVLLGLLRELRAQII